VKEKRRISGTEVRKKKRSRRRFSGTEERRKSGMFPLKGEKLTKMTEKSTGSGISGPEQEKRMGRKERAAENKRRAKACLHGRRSEPSQQKSLLAEPV